MNPPLPLSWRLPVRSLQFDQSPLLMGILNVTPDSFSDGGNYVDPHRALEQALALVQQGADIIDLGGESTRPNAPSVGEAEELARVLPVLELLLPKINVPISIDTYKSEVARRALDLGAQIVNDISGLTFDPQMIDLCAQTKAGVICMHIQGTPLTMQDNPRYVDPVIEIRDWLHLRTRELIARGIEPEAIVLDPGIGFGKTAEHNLQILSRMDEFHQLGFPLLVGHSRKRFLGKLLDRPIDERGFGTVGVSLALAEQRVQILRLHEITPTRDTLRAYRALRPIPQTNENKTARS